MLTVGITGRSGCGKSTVTECLVRHWAAVADADALSREILQPGSPVLAELAGRFGADILREGVLDRRLLADREAGQPWDGHMSTSGYALVPAACHPLYGALQLGSARGEVDGTVYSLIGDCFRNEPSPDPMRFVSFRMLEFVLVGTPEQALAHRQAMLELGSGLLRDLGLDVEIESANDPFFGRAGVMLAKGQLQAELKFEITAPVYGTHRTAIASGNYHEDHFGAEFDLHGADGSTAHSACFGFGLERVALALARVHGTELMAWPEQVRALLGLPTGEIG